MSLSKSTINSHQTKTKRNFCDYFVHLFLNFTFWIRKRWLKVLKIIILYPNSIMSIWNHSIGIFTWFWIFSCSSSFTSCNLSISFLILSFDISLMEPCDMAVIRESVQCLLKRIEFQEKFVWFWTEISARNEWRSYSNSIDSFYRLGNVCGNNIFKWLDFNSFKDGISNWWMCKQYGQSHDHFP